MNRSESTTSTRPWAPWLAHFEAQRTRPLPSTSGPHGLSPVSARALARSLAGLQLGETGEGRIAHEIERYADPGIDDDYRAALRLLVREEGRHAHVLGCALVALEAEPLRRHWTATLFVSARRLMGVRTKLLVLFAAEVIAAVMYGAFVVHLPDSDLRRALAQIQADEEQHVLFHADLFARVSRTRMSRLMFATAAWVVTAAALASVTLDHLTALRTLGIPIPALWAHARRKLSRTMATMPALSTPPKPRSSRWLRMTAVTTVVVFGACAVVPTLGRRALRDRLAQSARLAAHDPSERERVNASLRAENPEWVLLHHLFSVLSFANLALSKPRAGTAGVHDMDALIDDVLRAEQAHGQRAFLLPYVDVRPFMVGPPRSAFVDGELAVMLGARSLVVRALHEQGVGAGVVEREDYLAELRRRVASLSEHMERSAVFCAESYPNECWSFCTVIGLVAMRMLDELDGTDHSQVIARFIAVARKQLTDPCTGLWISSFDLAGTRHDGPEGSTIWMVAHGLALFDPELAADQFERAKRALSVSALGLSVSREWPVGDEGMFDIDVGPIVPWLGASAASSGFAILAASTFHDGEFADGLMRSLLLVGLPLPSSGGLRFVAGNALGDAVILYGMTQGPLWALLRSPSAPRTRA